METFIEENDPVFMEEHEIEYRNTSVQLATSVPWAYQEIRVKNKFYDFSIQSPLQIENY